MVALATWKEVAYERAWQALPPAGCDCPLSCPYTVAASTSTQDLTTISDTMAIWQSVLYEMSYSIAC